MTWRLAKSLEVLRTQLNAAYPDRSKASDGSIGDERHQKAGTSDHLPNSAGAVTAIDVTHDPAHLPGESLATALVTSRDQRIKYIIWNKHMVSSYPARGTAAWTWRSYGGSNSHTKHVHISVKPERAIYDSPAPWAIPSAEMRSEVDDSPPPLPSISSPSPKETSTERVITTTTTATPESTVEKKSIVSSVIGSEQLKTIASEGVTKLAARATGAMTTGSTAAATGGAATGKTWLIVLSIVLALGAIGVVLFLLWHKSRKEQQSAVINSDNARADITFKETE